MARLSTVVLFLVLVTCVMSAPARGRRKITRQRYSATAMNGSIGIAHLSDGTFGDGSFSIGHGGHSSGSGHGGHGGNYGTNSYGGSGGDSGHISYS